jgi:small subunit ribosomal protein S7
MSRRHRATERKITPDDKYGNIEIAKFITKVMQDGKKSVARKIVYGAIEKFTAKISAEDHIEAFERALENAKPQVEVKSRRIGGATYQVPVEIPLSRKRSLAMKWIIAYAKAKPGRNMVDALAQELQDCYNNQGSTIKKRDDVHRMAEANKAFAHYKW